MSAPLSTSSISSRWSSAAFLPTAGELAADVQLDVGVAHQQRLRVGVDRDELDALEPYLDHPVDGVDAAATDADDLDHGKVVVWRCHGLSLPFQGWRLPTAPAVRGPHFDNRCRTREGEVTLTLY
jgi:hypothetical protein